MRSVDCFSEVLSLSGPLKELFRQTELISTEWNDSKRLVDHETYRLLAKLASKLGEISPS